MTDASYSDASSGNVFAFTATVQADLLPLLALSYAHFQVRLSCDDVILYVVKNGGYTETQEKELNEWAKSTQNKSKKSKNSSNLASKVAKMKPSR